MTSAVSYELTESVATITLDDGKVNVLGPDMQSAINEALDRAVKDSAKAVVIAGNQRVFSGGFDLAVFQSGEPKAALGMLAGGFELSLRCLTFPVEADRVLARAQEVAAQAASTLHAGAHLATKLKARESALKAIQAGIDGLPTEFFS
jgi:enoyl-CoA hydratase/isomerase-like protein